MSITAAMVKELRDISGAGMMDAKKALTEIATKHPKTPWALLAKSDRTVAIGLRLTGDTLGGPK